MKKDILKPLIVLTAIAVLFTFFLAYTNMITKDKIAEVEKNKLNDTMKAVVPEADNFIEVKTGDNYILYECIKDSEVISYIANVSSTGYGGMINVVFAISEDREVVGVRVVSHSETPGVGEKATKDSFLNQFLTSPEDNFSISDDTRLGSIDKITGATISSKAITNAAVTAMNAFDDYIGKDAQTHE